MKKFHLIFKKEVEKEAYIIKVSNVLDFCKHQKKIMDVEATEEQVKLLKKDPNVLDLLPEEFWLTEVNEATKDVYYNRPSWNNEKFETDFGNWGLIRHSSLTDVGTSDTPVTATYEYNYDGSGVDIILNIASVLNRNDPEFKTGGVSRLQQFQWNTLADFEDLPTIDYSRTGQGVSKNVGIDDHAESVSYCAVSNTYGWATGATVYIYPRDQMDAAGKSLRSYGWQAMQKFHETKGNNRPTLVIDAIGYSATNIIGHYAENIFYRGTTYTSVAPAGASEQKVPLMAEAGSGKEFGMPHSNSYTSTGFVSDPDELIPQMTDVEKRAFFEDDVNNIYYGLYGEGIDNMVAAGVHHVTSAGNNSDASHLKGHPDYANNYKRVADVTTDGVHTRYFWYMLHGRGNPTYEGDTIVVGALAQSSSAEGFDGKEHFAQFSTRGSRVDACAAGDNIRLNMYSNGEYIANGTSFASPNVGGMAALVLGKYPTTTTKQLRRYFREQAVGTDKLHEGNENLAPSSKYGDPLWFAQSGGFGYSNNIAYLDPDLTFDPTTLPDTAIADYVPTTSDIHLNYTVDEINTKLGAI